MSEMKDVVVPEKFKALVESIEKMTVLDLAELVKLLEDKFGVSAAAPMMMGGMMPAAGAAGPAASEKTEFTVELTEAGANKIALIKAIRAATSMSLKEAKDITDAAPKVVKENMKKEEAEALKTALEAAGGKVTLK